MKTLSYAWKKFLKSEKGLETVEYAVISALITGAAILAITALGTAVAAQFNLLVSKL